MKYLIIYSLLEIVKRILSPFLYPIAYLLRDKTRNYKVILWNRYLIEPKIKPIYFFLDDSIYLEFNKEYADREKYYPYWLWKICSKPRNGFKDFLLSYWWSAIRNCMVNWNNWVAYKLGKFEGVVSDYGESDFLVLRDKRKGYRYELRMFENGIRPYLEFYFLGRWFQIGWLNGTAPRFEIDLFKKK